MRIYQYTNIEALAYILKNRTIRFNRLDKVDDIEEGNAESLGVKFCKYVFVSCWTEVEEESIPLWKMYGGDNGGVRIGIEQRMFKEYPISNLKLGWGQTQGNFLSKIPPHDMTNPNFFILPIMDYDNDLFYRHVRYVDDVYSYTKDAIQLTNIKGSRGDYRMQMKPFGYYKHKRWEFQKESRFVLYVFPLNPLLEGNNPEISSLVVQSYLGNKPLPFDDYYMNLNDVVFDDLEITLSPSATDAQRIIVESLKNIYAPEAHIKESSLGKLIRLK